jgi:transposase
MDRPTSKGSKDRSPSRDDSDIPERWSAPRKTALILRLLRGESLESLSRESQVPAHELECWHRAFLDAGTRGLKQHADPEERALRRTQAKLGEVMMRLELAEDLLEKKGYGEELRKRRP